MAAKTAVYVNPISVKAPFDKKFESSLPKQVKEGLEKAIDKSSKLESSDDKKASLSLNGNLKLTCDKKQLEAALSVVLCKDRSIFGGADNSAAMEVDDPAKVSADDVDALVEAILKDVGPDVVKELEKKLK